MGLEAKIDYDSLIQSFIISHFRCTIMKDGIKGSSKEGIFSDR